MIWVAGSRGMLGSALVRRLRSEGIPFAESDRDTDITDFSALKNFARGVFSSSQGGGAAEKNWIINCAAYTAVDKAEDEPEAVRALNAEGAGNLAETALQFGAGIIHISTDYVFGGTAKHPYIEDDPVSPIGVYGKTKLEGENLVRSAFSKSKSPWYIMRTAWLYGPRGKNFVYTMVNLMNSKPQVRVVSDQRGSPTFTEDLARYILMLILSGAESGVYHYSGEGETTWFDFACEIYRLGREKGRILSDCSVIPCLSSEYPSKAARPAYSVLSKAKLKRALGVKLPRWEESLRAFISSPDFAPNGEASDAASFFS